MSKRSRRGDNSKRQQPIQQQRAQARQPGSTGPGKKPGEGQPGRTPGHPGAGTPS